MRRLKISKHPSFDIFFIYVKIYNNNKKNQINKAKLQLNNRSYMTAEATKIVTVQSIIDVGTFLYQQVDNFRIPLLFRCENWFLPTCTKEK